MVRKCSECEQPITAGSSVTCSEDCARVRRTRKDRERRRKKIAQGKQACSECGQTVPFGRSVTCGEDCARARGNRKRKERERMRKRERAPKKTCDWCGQEFSARRGIYCSDACKAEQKQKNREEISAIQMQEPVRRKAPAMSIHDAMRWVRVYNRQHPDALISYGKLEDKLHRGLLSIEMLKKWEEEQCRSL